MKEIVRKWLAEQVGEDEALLASLYGDYRSTAGEQCRQALQDLEAGDFKALDRDAHALKGVVLTVGDTEMLEAVLALRDAAKAGDASAARAAWAQMDALRAAL